MRAYVDTHVCVCICVVQNGLNLVGLFVLRYLSVVVVVVVRLLNLLLHQRKLSSKHKN